MTRLTNRRTRAVWLTAPVLSLAACGIGGEEAGRPFSTLDPPGLTSEGPEALAGDVVGAAPAVDYVAEYDPVTQVGSPSIIDPWRPLTDDDELRTVQLDRRAIFQGRYIGKRHFGDMVNAALLEHDVEFRYVGGEALVSPLLSEIPQECPYLRRQGNDGSNCLSCRYVVERATDAAYIHEARILHEENPLGFDYDLDGHLGTRLHWYEHGYENGVEVERVMAVQALRDAGACDADLTPVQSAFEKGREIGRALYMEVHELVVANTPNTECDITGGILVPTQNQALEQLEQAVTANPLCGEAELRRLEDLAGYRYAEQQVRLGVRDGIRDADAVAAEILSRTWVCEPVRPRGGHTPVVLDLDGDGVSLSGIADGASFDITGRGRPHRLTWPKGSDALLALDLDGDGAITTGRELFGNYTLDERGKPSFAHGFEALAARDGNADGRIDALDTVFSRLLGWRDRDRNGRSRPDELRPLAELGVQSVSLAFEERTVRSGGGLLKQWASYERADGSRGLAVDAWFSSGVVVGAR